MLPSVTRVGGTHEGVTLQHLVQEVQTKRQKAEGVRKPSTTKLNNMIMQMRKNCNHPDLISSAFTNEVCYPSSQELLEQCGKLQLLHRLLTRLNQRGHKVLIFSQVHRALLAPMPLPWRR